MKKGTKKEAAIIRDIRGYLRARPDCFFWKEHGGIYGTAGIPDIICCISGRFVAFEAKRPGNKPTELQKKAISDIWKAGGLAYVVYSVEDVENILKGAMNNGESLDETRPRPADEIL